MAKVKDSIRSAHVELRLLSASIVEGALETRLVFPAIVFKKKDSPPKKALNSGTNTPRVVGVDVHMYANDEKRRRYYGHSGVERLSVFLAPDEFARWVEAVKQIGTDPIRLSLDVDDGGDITQLSINDRAVVAQVSSETIGLSTASSSRTGT